MMSSTSTGLQVLPNSACYPLLIVKAGGQARENNVQTVLAAPPFFFASIVPLILSLIFPLMFWARWFRIPFKKSFVCRPLILSLKKSLMFWARWFRIPMKTTRRSSVVRHNFDCAFSRWQLRSRISVPAKWMVKKCHWLQPGFWAVIRIANTISEEHKKLTSTFKPSVLTADIQCEHVVTGNIRL